LNGLDFEQFKPRVLIVENMFGDDEYRQYMRAKGYELWRNIDPNDIYVAGSELRVGDRVARSISHLATRGRQFRALLKARYAAKPQNSKDLQSGRTDPSAIGSPASHHG
jgi:hypothetical protein